MLVWGHFILWYNKPMDELINAIKVLLADTVALKYKAQGYHWNVESDDFKPWHSFFGEIYEDLSESEDDIAEWIRILYGYAPFKLSRFMELSTIAETEVSSDPMMMAQDLYNAIETYKMKFVELADMAMPAKEYALANYLNERQGAMQKFCWQLRASLKDVGE